LTRDPISFQITNTQSRNGASKADSARFPPARRGLFPLWPARLSSRTAAFFQNLAQQFGTFRISGSGRSKLFPHHPDYIKDVLVTNHQNFMKGLALQRAKRLLGEACSRAKESFIAGSGVWLSRHFTDSESLPMRR